MADLTKVRKLCNKCKKKLPIETKDGLFNFSKRSASKDGFTYTCKTCETLVAMESYHRRRGYNQAKKQIVRKAEETEIIQKTILPFVECLPYDGAPSPEALKFKEQHFEKLRANPTQTAYADLLERDSVWVRIRGDERFIPQCQLCKVHIYDPKHICIGERMGKDRIVLDPYENKMLICNKCQKLIAKGVDQYENSSTSSGSKRGNKSSSETSGDQEY